MVVLGQMRLKLPAATSKMNLACHASEVIHGAPRSEKLPVTTQNAGAPADLSKSGSLATAS
eukprot:6199821-Pleurochrysis_carterae.AAC.1